MVDHNSRIRVFSILVLVVQVTTRIRRRRISFLQVALRKKGKITYKIRRPDCFLSYKSLKPRKRRIFCRRATYKGTYIEAVEFRQGWSVTINKGAVRKKGRRPRKVVCLHKQGTWEKRKTKEGGLSPQEGDKRKKEKKKTKEGEKVAPQRQGSVCPQPRISFFGSRVFGFGSGPSCLKYRLLRDLAYEEDMCKGSSGKGLPYAARAVP
jgi:hypothetical protein